ncbi:MAG: repair protein RadC [Clostridia bacterium]|nr:repair protein RadC [Clostridia bacterium]
MRQLTLMDAEVNDYGRSVAVVRLSMVREREAKFAVNEVRSPGDAARLAKEFLAGADREYFIVLCLDTKNRVNAINTVSVGTLNSSLVHPREVFKAAILANAAAVVVAHNHPSGDPEPSREDVEVTRRLVEAGKIMGIEVLDHIVIGDENYTSFKQRGLI